MNASMQFSTDAPLNVRAEKGLFGDDRIFLSTLAGTYWALSVEEAKHVRDRLSVVLVEVEEAAKVAQAA